MNCETMRQLLDAYIDGTLSSEELCALEDHASACEACREELAAARLLKDTLAHVDDEIQVPLEAQAAWRRAVRAEAGAKKRRGWMRGAYAVAAALVLVLGASFAMQAGNTDNNTVTLSLCGNETSGIETSDNAAASRSIIDRDGVAQTDALSLEDADEVYAVWKKLEVDSVEDALKQIEILSSEYSGTCVLEENDGCRVELSLEYLEDFLKAASQLGAESYSEVQAHDSETASVLFQLTEKN